MRRNQFFRFYDRLVDEARRLVGPKNEDYGADEDALRNFRLAEAIGGDAGEGILYRITDKVARLWILHHKGAAVRAETKKDTALDLINYVVIYMAWDEEENGAMSGGVEEMKGPVKWPEASISKGAINPMVRDMAAAGCLILLANFVFVALILLLAKVLFF